MVQLEEFWEPLLLRLPEIGPQGLAMLLLGLWDAVRMSWPLMRFVVKSFSEKESCTLFLDVSCKF